jgi:hypothetical protein
MAKQVVKVYDFKHNRSQVLRKNRCEQRVIVAEKIGL